MDKYFLIDSNVLIDLYHHFAYASEQIRKLDIKGKEAICLISYMEFMNGVQGKYRKSAKKFLDSISSLPMLPETDTYGKAIANAGLIKHKGHVQDCLIAAIALAYDIPLVTANVKDFQGLHEDLQIIPYIQYTTWLQDGGTRLTGVEEDATLAEMYRCTTADSKQTEAKPGPAAAANLPTGRRGLEKLQEYSNYAQ